MRLEPPPLWQYLLLEQPWPVVVALGVAAVVLTVLAQRRQSRRLRMAAWVLAVVAGGVYAVAWQVTTDREQLLASTEALIAATESPMDIDALVSRWLSVDAALTGPDGALWLDRDGLEGALESANRRYPIDQHTIRRLDAATQRTDHGRSVVELSTQVRDGGAGGLGAGGFGPVRTEWDLYWGRDDQGRWQVQEIRWMRVRDHEPRPNMLPR